MTDQYPPQGYVKAESTIDGIDIFMPALANQSVVKEVVDFKCSQCGGTTAFSAADGVLICSYCGFHESPNVDIVGKQADEFEFTVETMEQAAQGWGETRKEMVCENCGVQISIPIEDLTHTCAFCGSNKVIQRKPLQDVLRPRHLISFKHTPADCQNVARKWLGSSWMTPKDLSRISSLGAFTAVYLPFWTFDAVTKASWKAEVGHTKTKRTFENGKWKDRVVVEWRWESGQVELTIDDLLIEGTSRLSALLLGQVNNFDLRALVSYEPGFLAGQQAQAYDIPLEEAWENGRRQMREKTRQACINRASTSMVRNFSMNLDFSEESWRYILLPIYLANYTYDGKPYQVIINGQNGVIAGQRPVDWAKIWLVVAALLTPGILIGLVGIATIIFGGIGVAIGGFGFFLLLLGIVISAVIILQAQKLDDA